MNFTPSSSTTTTTPVDLLYSDSAPSTSSAVAVDFVGLGRGVAYIFALVYVSAFCVVLACVCNASLAFLLYRSVGVHHLRLYNVM